MPNSVRFRHFAMVAALAMLLTGCIPASFAETPFEREAGDTASLISAAATTIEFLHDDKIDRRYAEASLVVYRQSVADSASKLESAQGAPGEATLNPVLDDVKDAQDILARPCLDDSCDWHGQIRTLTSAKDALLEISQ